MLNTIEVNNHQFNIFNSYVAVRSQDKFHFLRYNNEKITNYVRN